MQMREDNETISHQLKRMLDEAGYSISLATILRCQSELSWTFRGSAYCQFIHNVNKEKRLTIRHKAFK